MKHISESMAKLREVALRGMELAATPEAIAAREEWERKECIRAELEAQEAEREAWKRRGVPKRLWEQLKQPPRETSAYKRVREFLEHGSEWVLFLAGVVGTGKTFAAAWAVAKNPGLFVKAAGIQGSGPFDRERRTRLEESPLLVIDDLAAEILDSKQFFQGYLTQLLDHRYDAATKTIITTNVSVQAFRKQYGEGAGKRLLDRVNDQGSYFHVDEVESMRGKDPGVLAAEQLIADLGDE